MSVPSTPEDASPKPTRTAAAVLAEWKNATERTATLGDISGLAAAIRTIADTASEDCGRLKQAALHLILQHCSEKLEESDPTTDIGALIGAIQFVTERGNNTLLSRHMIPAVESVHSLATIIERDEVRWLSICSACFLLIKNNFLTPVSVNSTMEIEAALRVVAATLLKNRISSLDVAVKSVGADGISILQSIKGCLKIDQSFLHDSAQQYFRLLCLFATRSDVAVSAFPVSQPPTDSAIPVQPLRFPPSSAALVARDMLLDHLQSDTYHAFYYLRAFLHENHVREAQVLQNLQLMRTPPASTTYESFCSEVEVAVVRGALTALEHYIFPPKPATDSGVVVMDQFRPLTTKEMLVVLPSFRYALSLRAPPILHDVLSFLKVLLQSDVAPHLESQWFYVLGILNDLVACYETDPLPWLWPLILDILYLLNELKERIALDIDIEKCVDLLDTCSGLIAREESRNNWQPRSKDLVQRVINHKLNPSVTCDTLKKVMTKYLCSPCFGYDIKAHCLYCFKGLKPQLHPKYFEVGLLNIIPDVDTGKTFYPTSKWDTQVASDVVAYMMELLSPSSTDGSFIDSTSWSELVKVCKSIVCEDGEGTALPAEKRWQLCVAMVEAAGSRLSVTAEHATDLWHALIGLLQHPKANVRSLVINSFLELSCSSDFELLLSPKSRTESVLVVAREPTCSVEAEFPCAELLEALVEMVSSKPVVDLSSHLKLLRHLLSDCNFILGNPTKTAPALNRLATALKHLMSEEGIAEMSKSLGAAPISDIISTTTCLAPFAHLFPAATGAKAEFCRTLLSVLASVFRKVLELLTLFPMMGPETAVPVLSEACGAFHVSLFQYVGVQDLIDAPEIGNAAVDVVCAIGDLLPKAAGLLEPGVLHKPQQQVETPHPLSPTASQNLVQSPLPATPGGRPDLVPDAPGSGSATPDPHPGDYVSHESRQCLLSLLSLLSLLHTIVSSPLIDSRVASSDFSPASLHPFSAELAAFLLKIVSGSLEQHPVTPLNGHRLLFLAHLTLVELLQHNRRVIMASDVWHSLLRQLFSLAPSSALSTSVEQALSEHQEGASTDPAAADGNKDRPASPNSGAGTPTAARKRVSRDAARGLLRGTADLAWRLYFLGSSECYPQWDPLTEALFSGGKIQSWIVHTPQTPCVFSATIGRSQHLLVTLRMVTGSFCWTCILHNKPSLPMYLPDMTSGQLDQQQLQQQQQAQLHTVTSMSELAEEDVLPRWTSDHLPPYPAESLLQDHEEEMRGLLRIESSASSLAGAVDEGEGEGRSTSPHLDPPGVSPNATKLSKCAPIPAAAAPGGDKSDDALSSHRDCSLSAAPPPPPQRFAEIAGLLGNTIHGAALLAMFRITPPPQRLRWDEQTQRSVTGLDKVPCKETHKIGLVYIDHGQYSPEGKEVLPDTPAWGEREFAVLSNDGGSKRYQEFMGALGRFKDLKVPKEDLRETVRRGMWPHPCYYFGALDSTPRQQDGVMCLTTEGNVHQIVYHVATIMNSAKPDHDDLYARRSAADKKKRHIGNDHVVVTYCEDPSRRVDPFVLKNELNCINILIQPLAEGYSRVSLHFRGSQADKNRSLQQLFEEVCFGPGLCKAEGGVVVPDSKLAAFVGTTALHASVATKSWAHERQQYIPNWTDRFQRIQQLQTRYLAKPEQKTADDRLLEECNGAAGVHPAPSGVLGK